MEVSSTPDTQLMANVQVAVQSKVLQQMKTQGADVVNLIASAAPTGSVNLPGQGQHVDARC